MKAKFFCALLATSILIGMFSACKARTEEMTTTAKTTATKAVSIEKTTNVTTETTTQETTVHKKALIPRVDIPYYSEVINEYIDYFNYRNENNIQDDHTDKYVLNNNCKYIRVKLKSGWSYTWFEKYDNYHLAYSLYDIDNNGIQELLMRIEDSDMEEGTRSPTDIFTWKDGEIYGFRDDIGIANKDVGCWINTENGLICTFEDIKAESDICQNVFCFYAYGEDGHTPVLKAKLVCDRDTFGNCKEWDRETNEYNEITEKEFCDLYYEYSDYHYYCDYNYNSENSQKYLPVEWIRIN